VERLWIEKKTISGSRRGRGGNTGGRHEGPHMSHGKLRNIADKRLFLVNIRERVLMRRNGVVSIKKGRKIKGQGGKY